MTVTKQQFEEHVRERLLVYAPDDLRHSLEAYLQNVSASAMQFVDPDTLLFYKPEALKQKLEELGVTLKKDGYDSKSFTPSRIIQNGEDIKSEATNILLELRRLITDLSEVANRIDHMIQPIPQPTYTESTEQINEEKKSSETQQTTHAANVTATTEEKPHKSAEEETVQSAIHSPMQFQGSEQTEDNNHQQEAVTRDPQTSNLPPIAVDKLVNNNTTDFSHPDPTPAIHALKDAGDEAAASRLEQATQDPSFDTSWLFENGRVRNPQIIKTLMQSETIGKQIEQAVAKNSPSSQPAEPDSGGNKTTFSLLNPFRKNN